jgi:amino acid adenylation domain-containing protein
LCLDRGPEMITAMLAVWWAGGAFLPLDPGYPAQRVGFMVADSGARVVVARRGRGGGLGGVQADGRGVVVVWLDDLPAAAPAALAGVVGAPAGGQLAYVMYTSGSTGVPKGVLCAHRGLVNRLVWMQRVYRLAVGERVLHKTAVTFDVSLWEMWWPLVAGGCVVVAAPGRQGDLDYLGGVLRRQAVGVAHFIPSLFAQFAGYRGAGRLADLRLVGCSGEALAGGDVARFYAWHSSAVVVNLYGPTEASIEVSSWACPRPGDAGAPPIGAPIANTRLHVLDRWLNVVPAGVGGELFIGGVGLARGYGGRAALTAERFVADRFAGDGSRLYRTGDRARWRADGVLEFLGRADDQVKVRGFRIEPGEIEAVLAAHRGVRTAVVTAAGDGTQRLVAYLVPADQGAGVPPAGELRAFVRDKLPEFMVPAVFTELASLPLTLGGKLDRAALPAPGATRPELEAGYVPPSSPAQELLAGIWAQVLGLDQVGVHDNFFDLGGHSLLATQVVSRIREVFGVELPLATIFDQPTIAQTALAINESADLDGSSGEEYEEFEF